MAGKVIVALDQSTAGTKAMVFGREAEILGKAALSHKQHYPAHGFVEHDMEEIFENSAAVMNKALESAGISWKDVDSIALTNQRETVAVWDKDTLAPLHRAVVWQDRRGADKCAALESEFNYLREKTGLEPSPFFSAPKLSWLIENADAVRKSAETGSLAFGTVDSFLLSRLTGKAHKTDMTNAGRTMLMDIEALKWDAKAFEIFEIPMASAPEIVFSDDICETTRDISGIPAGIPVASMIGDSHGALYGELCFEESMAKVTYGTGSSVVMNTGKNIIRSKNRLSSSVGYATKSDFAYCIEGNINTTGAVIKWLADNLRILDSPRDAGEIASKARADSGVYFIPALEGLAAPHWKSGAKAAFTGMTGATTYAELIRAAEESIAYSIADVVKAMEGDALKPLCAIMADGGAVGDMFLMQFQADILGVEVVTNAIEEVSAMGAAFIAGLATGFWKSRDEISALKRRGKTYTPKIDGAERRRLYGGWLSALEKLL